MSGRMRQIFAALGEEAYKGNLGFAEMVTFYRMASESDIRKMERLLRDGDADGAWKLLKRVTGVKLHDF